MNHRTTHNIANGYRLYLRQWKKRFQSSNLIVRLTPAYMEPPEFALEPEVQTWCETYCQAAWGIEYLINARPNMSGITGITNFHIVFEHPDDQFAFKMRWL